MKRLYARFVLWLVRPALNLVAAERASTVAQIDALSARIDVVQLASNSNACAIDAERAARQIGDAALQARFTAQSREF
ncbi:hypothetical protein WL14_20925 [Burkholderia cepacia]|uniref:hypothetical protein n=1 Tax=Burkholderia cepacia TaxID=292 RepID=UPI0007609C22|nr:hypothetical protein [Burkholderia cepacia]KVZ22348.1 hypothetical protein WL14_20925 [Burkholderia cepacia]